MFPVSRRAFLAAPILVAFGGSVAGCTTPPAPVADDPDRDALTQALTVEESLLSLAETWEEGSGLQRAIVRVLNAHVTRLTQTLGTSVSPSMSPEPTPTQTQSTQTQSTQTQALRSAATGAAVAHTKASRDAGPQTAQLLASIAAADAAIDVALGGGR